MKAYTNSHITHLIDEWIHNARDRRIMKYHYVDGLSAEFISQIDSGKTDIPEEIRIDLTPRRISQILSDRLLEISPYL